MKRQAQWLVESFNKRSHGASIRPDRATCKMNSANITVMHIPVLLSLLFLNFPVLAAQGTRDNDWALHGGNFRGEHFSALEQVNKTTVGQLGLDWALDLPAPDGIAATPIVVDGVIYLSGPFSVVFAVQATSGRLLWTYEPDVKISDANDWTARVNRGVAVSEEKVLVTVSDCRLVALDQKTGTEIWSKLTCDPEFGYSITDAPHIGGGKVFVGNAGSESHFKNRGYVSAYNISDGSFLWRFYTVPSDNPEENTTPAMQMAAKTWSGDTLKKFGGGGSVWNEMTYDEDTGLLYFGTAGTLPYLHHERSPEGGDNLFTSSVVAIRADTGEYVWHYQTMPEDSWDYNANMNIIVADLDIGGKPRKALLIAPKNGFFYVLDRINGELLSANNYVKINWASHIDLETGRPVLDPAAMYWKAPPGTTVDIWPNMWGAHSTQPMAYYPLERLVYIPAVNVPQVVTVLDDGEDLETMAVYDEVDGKPHVPGKLIAWDPVTQRERWSVDHAVAFNGGVLATAGGLIFQGDAEGAFSAYDAGNGKRLWSVDTGSAITATPVTYTSGKNQHVLIPIGAGSAMQFSYPTFHAGRKATGPARLLSFSLTGKVRIPITTYQAPELPELQPLTASPDEIETGRQLYLDAWCSGCHGDGAVAHRGGTVPDLRYASPETHQQWDGIVIGGARLSKGMPAHDLSPEEAQAIRAWIISKSHELVTETP